MAKPRIIIADTDINYVIPIQLKFAEDFFEKIDLEIVTDQEYFREMFLFPQKADILIISENLYDASIQRHNISNIFLMTEQNEEEQTADLNVSRIFKYTSIKEIFNEITGKCAEIFNVDRDSKKTTQIVLVCSACGGVGKTTVAMGVSACLTKNFKRVLYLNAGYMQTFQRMLDNSTPISAAEVYDQLASASDDIYDRIKYVIRKEIFSYLPPFKAALVSLGLSYSVYREIAVSARKSADFDYIVIDADAIFDEHMADLIGIADKVIMVTAQTSGAVYATNLLIANASGMTGEKYIFVCNDFKKEEYNALISPEMEMKFSVSDYIEHVSRYDQMRCADLIKDNGIQKTAFLVM